MRRGKAEKPVWRGCREAGKADLMGPEGRGFLSPAGGGIGFSLSGPLTCLLQHSAFLASCKRRLCWLSCV